MTYHGVITGTAVRHSPAALLLDLNGVLIDDEPLHHRAWQSVLAAAGIDLDETTYRRSFAGTRWPGRAARYLADRGVRDLDVMFARKQAAYEELVHQIPPAEVPGARELVDALLVQTVPFAIVTSSTRREARLALRSMGLADRMPQVVSAEDVEQGKPDPEGYLLAARRLTVPIARCTAIEDTPVGVEAARRAGATVIAVCTTHDATALADADHVAEDLRDVLRLLELPRAAPA